MVHDETATTPAGPLPCRVPGVTLAPASDAAARQRGHELVKLTNRFGEWYRIWVEESTQQRGGYLWWAEGFGDKLCGDSAEALEAVLCDHVALLGGGNRPLCPPDLRRWDREHMNVTPLVRNFGAEKVPHGGEFSASDSAPADPNIISLNDRRKRARG